MGENLDGGELLSRAVAGVVIAAAVLQDQADDERGREGALGGGKPDAGDESADDVGDNQGDGGEGLGNRLGVINGLVMWLTI